MAERIPCPWCDGRALPGRGCPWCGGDYEINAPDREPPPASLYDQLPADCEPTEPSNENKDAYP